MASGRYVTWSLPKGLFAWSTRDYTKLPITTTLTPLDASHFLHFRTVIKVLVGGDSAAPILLLFIATLKQFILSKRSSLLNFPHSSNTEQHHPDTSFHGLSVRIHR